MEERLQGNPVSEGIAYAKSYIYIPGTLTKAPEFFPKGQEEEKYREFRESCEKADSELVTLYNGMCKEDPIRQKSSVHIGNYFRMKKSLMRSGRQSVRKA